MPIPRQIFIASTAEDLKEYRAVAVHVVDALGHKPVHMETFGAMAAPSLSACRQLVRQCDAVIVIVGHRFGWIPPIEQGGDGRKSVTWHEVDAARAAVPTVPVFAFIVDDQVSWAQAQEQDRLVNAEPNEIPSIVAAVKGLKEFKAELRKYPCAGFSSVDDFKARLATSLAMWLVAIPPPHLTAGWWVHPQIGMRMPAPDGWWAAEVMNNTSLLAPDVHDGFCDNFNVQVRPVPPGVPLEMVVGDYVGQMENVWRYTVESAQAVKIEDFPAALVTSRGRPPGQVGENVTCALLILRGPLVIEVTATTLPSTWPTRQAVIEDALRRVSFKPQ